MQRKGNGHTNGVAKGHTTEEIALDNFIAEQAEREQQNIERALRAIERIGNALEMNLVGVGEASSAAKRQADWIENAVLLAKQTVEAWVNHKIQSETRSMQITSMSFAMLEMIFSSVTDYVRRKKPPQVRLPDGSLVG